MPARPIRIMFSRNSGPAVYGGMPSRPEVGKSLRVFLDNGREVRTSIVLEIARLPDSPLTIITTQHSTYQVRVVP